MSDKYEAKDCVGFDPKNPEDCRTTLGEVIEFINAERAAAGLKKAKTIIVSASDVPYDEFEGDDPFGVA